MSIETNEVVYPFLNWSLVQGGRVEFVDRKAKTHLQSPLFQDVPYGIVLKQQKAEKSSFWLKADKPWESMSLSGYLTVIYENGIYRLWYASLATDFAETGDFGSRLCYAESSDGFNWEKPIVGLIEYKGSKQNNIVFDSNLNGGLGYHGGTVFVDPIAPLSERYKLIYMASKNNIPQIKGAVSEDGLFWKPMLDPLLDNYFSDTQTTAYYDIGLGAYVGYFRDWTRNGFNKSLLYRKRIDKEKLTGGIDWSAFSRRIIARAVTEDFRRWSVPEPILELDATYHPSHDLYTNAHILYPGREDLHLMFPAQYDREKDSLEVHLATSDDGIKWTYFGDNPVVTLGDRGSGQEGAIYAGCGIVSLDKEKIAVPCSGFPFTHNDYIPGKADYLGGYFWATWRKDRLVAIEAAEDGEFSLPILALTDQMNTLSINFETKSAGRIMVQISDEKGEPIPGYTFSECNLINGDSLDYQVTWRENIDLNPLFGKRMIVQFHLHQAKIYSFNLSHNMEVEPT